MFMLAVTGDQFVSMIESAHPELEGLIIRPERLTGLDDGAQS
jgi:hypothetical protein